VVGIGIHALDEEPVELSLQAGWKQQRHTELVEPIDRNRIEAVFRSLKFHTAPERYSQPLKQVAGVRPHLYLALVCFEFGWRHSRGAIVFAFLWSIWSRQ
jgi:hypothetical protein